MSAVITVNRHKDASPGEVWAVISDGWSYASWVVGASRIRAVSSDWPAEGARIHHSVGARPAEATLRLALIAERQHLSASLMQRLAKPRGLASRVAPGGAGLRPVGLTA
jgi:hypothetical protein